MNSMNYIRVFELHEQAFQDKDFQKLCREYERAQKQFERILQDLTEEQQADIGSFLYIAEKMHFYLMSLICDR